MRERGCGSERVRVCVGVRESVGSVCMCVWGECVLEKSENDGERERGAEMRCVRIFKRVGGIFKTIERAIHR